MLPTRLLDALFALGQSSPGPDYGAIIAEALVNGRPLSLAAVYLQVQVLQLEELAHSFITQAFLESNDGVRRIVGTRVTHCQETVGGFSQLEGMSAQSYNC
jgi:hypothetical protein